MAEKPEKTQAEKDAEEAEKERKAEEKQKKDEEKARKKWYDDADENFCGFVSLMNVDSDGYAKKTKGMEIKGPLFLVSDGTAGDPVVLETEFTPNPLFYMEVPNQDNLLLFGKWWIGENASTLGTIGTSIPKACTAAHKDMEKTSTSEFNLDVEMPLLKNAPSRLVKAVITTKEQKLVTKVVKIRLEVPRASWKEWKDHRRRFHDWGKNQAGAGPGGDDKKEDEKKE